MVGEQGVGRWGAGGTRRRGLRAGRGGQWRGWRRWRGWWRAPAATCTSVLLLAPGAPRAVGASAACATWAAAPPSVHSRAVHILGSQASLARQARCKPDPGQGLCSRGRVLSHSATLGGMQLPKGDLYPYACLGLCHHGPDGIAGHHLERTEYAIDLPKQQLFSGYSNVSLQAHQLALSGLSLITVHL